MSDTPDRFGLFDGGTGFGRPSCDYPASSSAASVGERETAASSAPSDDYSELFDWDAFARDHATDVTTHSDAASEARRPAGASAQPLAALPGGSSHEDDYPMTDAPPEEPQPPLVWPSVSGPHPPRDPNIHFESSPSPTPHTTMPPALKKTRTLKHPEETSAVRELKACYRCKMSKTGCDPLLICRACSKRPLAEYACIRNPLQGLVSSMYARWNWNDPNFFMPGCAQFKSTGGCTLFISCSDQIESPLLEVEARPFDLPNRKEQDAHGTPRLGIVPNEGPSEAMIYRWMRQQILVERKGDFEAEMDRLLLGFVLRAETRKALETGALLESLLSNLLKMKCMWKVWTCKQLFSRVRRDSVGTRFDLRLASIQDSLRVSAAGRISELERAIIGDIEKYFLYKKEPAGAAAETRSIHEITSWLVLWQMILIYRQSLGWTLEQQQTNAAPISIAVMPIIEKRHTFRETTKRLLDAITVIYSAAFHKKATVRRIKAAGPQVFGEDHDLCLAYQKALQALPEFYHQALGRFLLEDELFIEFIVKKEVDIMAKSPTGRK